jgi:3-hydroxyisobutyrate dehydrogenase and related beta-hydroxyacid dehydrogenases
MAKIGFAGLGRMGIPILRNISRKFEVDGVYNRNSEKAVLFPGIKFYDEPYRLASACDIIFVCLTGDSACYSFFLGERGLLSTIRANSIVVNLSTTSVSLAAELSVRCTAAAVNYLEATMLGDVRMAMERRITSLVSGDQASYGKVSEIIDAYSSQKHFLASPHGSVKMKLIADQLSATILASSLESIVAAERLGIPREKSMEIISQGPCSSEILSLKKETVMKGEFLPGTSLRDLTRSMRGVEDLSAEPGLSMPISSVSNSIYRSAMLLGLGNLDYSSVLKAFLHLDGRL